MQGLRLQQAGDAASPDPEKWLHAIEWEAADVGEAAGARAVRYRVAAMFYSSRAMARNRARWPLAVTATLRQKSANAQRRRGGH